MSDETDIHQPAPPVQPHFKEIDGRLDILERKMKVVMHTQGMDGCGLPGHKAVMGDEGTCYCETCEALAKKPAEPIKHEPNCNDMLFGKPNCTCRNTRPAESCECFYNSEMGQREYCTKHEEEARWPAYPVQPSNLPASEITAHDGIAVGMPVHPAAWMEVAADECARDAFPKSQTDIFKSNNRLLFKKIIAARKLIAAHEKMQDKKIGAYMARWRKDRRNAVDAIYFKTPESARSMIETLRKKYKVVEQ